jgi:dihydroorotase
MNEGEISSRLGLKGWPAVAEEAIIARDVLLADHVQSRLHICHLTTAGGVEIIRWAKARGINVTAEVTPHHLLLTDESALGYDPIFKVNPPLRTQKDVEALREGLADGTIDIVATDHAPHPAEAKECEWQEAAFGMLGLESALSIINQTMVAPGLMNWESVADRMSYAPARIARYAEHGKALTVGAIANITLINPAQTYRVDRDLVASRSRNTPFHGMDLQGVVTATFFRGLPTYLNGKLSSIHQDTLESAGK